MQPGQVAAEARPRQHRPDDDVSQRVADEAASRERKKNNRQARGNRHLEWAAEKIDPPTLLTRDTLHSIALERQPATKPSRRH